MFRLLNEISERINQLSEFTFLSISFMFVVIVWLLQPNSGAEHMFDWVSAEGVMYMMEKYDHATFEEMHYRFK